MKTYFQYVSPDRPYGDPRQPYWGALLVLIVDDDSSYLYLYEPSACKALVDLAHFTRRHYTAAPVLAVCKSPIVTGRWECAPVQVRRGSTERTCDLNAFEQIFRTKSRQSKIDTVRKVRGSNISFERCTYVVLRFNVRETLCRYCTEDVIISQLYSHAIFADFSLANSPSMYA